MHPDNTVDASNGYPLGVNEALSIGMENRGAQQPERPVLEVWGLSAGADSDVAVLTEAGI